jgi:hypothetical protein
MLNVADSPKGALEEIGLELAGVLVLAVVAGTGPRAGRAVVWVVVLLWLVFLVSHYTATKVSSTT